MNRHKFIEQPHGHFILCTRRQSYNLAATHYVPFCTFHLSVPLHRFTPFTSNKTTASFPVWISFSSFRHLEKDKFRRWFVKHCPHILGLILGQIGNLQTRWLPNSLCSPLQVLIAFLSRLLAFSTWKLFHQLKQLFYPFGHHYFTNLFPLKWYRKFLSFLVQYSKYLKLASSQKILRVFIPSFITLHCLIRPTKVFQS